VIDAKEEKLKIVAKGKPGRWQREKKPLLGVCWRSWES